jgi:hypothetical protein
MRLGIPIRQLSHGINISVMRVGPSGLGIYLWRNAEDLPRPTTSIWLIMKIPRRVLSSVRTESIDQGSSYALVVVIPVLDLSVEPPFGEYDQLIRTYF